MWQVYQACKEADEVFLLKGIKLRHYLIFLGKVFSRDGTEYSLGLHSKSQTTLILFWNFSELFPWLSRQSYFINYLKKQSKLPCASKADLGLFFFTRVIGQNQNNKNYKGYR